jgi:hypothetical protein
MRISFLWLHATCQAHLIRLHFIALIILCKEYKLWNSLCNFIPRQDRIQELIKWNTYRTRNSYSLAFLNYVKRKRQKRYIKFRTSGLPTSQLLVLTPTCLAHPLPVRPSVRLSVYPSLRFKFVNTQIPKHLLWMFIAIASFWIKTMDERQDGVLGEAVVKLG